MINTVTIPWPPKECSPNARVHRMVLAKAKAAYKDVCYLLAKESKMQAPDYQPLVCVEFFPPDKRRRDVDNALASIKAGIDGIAQAIGIDDSNFKEYRLSMKKQGGSKTGYVIVTLKGSE